MLPDLSRWIKTVLAGILGALLLVSLLAREDITVNAMDFTLGLQVFEHGYTVIDIPPLGTVRARTHQFPLLFRVTLRNINLERLSALVHSEQPRALFAGMRDDLRRQVVRFLLRALALAFVGGLGAGFALYRRGRDAAVAGFAGLLFFALLFGIAYYTYDEAAFREPEFHGIVEAAPWLIGVAEEALAAVQDLDAKLKIVADNLLVLFDSLSDLGREGGAAEGELKVLHISDIHNNPIGVSLAKQIAVSFRADIIVDTGDITDYGTRLEAELLRGIEEIGLPWIFVPGNHDSPAVIETLRNLENVWVLEDDVAIFPDLDFAVAGAADPSSQGAAIQIPSREQYKEVAQKLRLKIDQAEVAPPIIAGHHVYLVEEFAGRYAVLLYGHSHRADIRVRDNALMVNAGTTGGAGIRGLMAQGELPYTMVLLHFNRDGHGWYASVADVITVNKLDSGFVLERQLLHQPRPPLPLQQQEGEFPRNGEEKEEEGS